MTAPNIAPDAGETPADTYRACANRERTREADLQRRHILLGYLRLMLGVAAVVLLWPAVHRSGLFWAWLLLPVLLFALAARRHGHVLAGLARSRRTLAFYEHCLARTEDRWTSLRPRQTRADLTNSLYATDLDLFGSGSLFELLCEARTSLGEDMLASWLLAPAPVPAVRERQVAVAELRGRLNLRERWASAPGPLVSALETPGLLRWAAASHPGLPAFFRVLTPLLAILTLIAGARYAVTHSALLLIPLLVLNASLTFFLKGRYTPSFVEAQRLGKAMTTCAELFGSIEAQSFTSPLLQRLQDDLRIEHETASGAIKHLAIMSEWIDARGNLLVRLLDTPLLYSLHLALVAQAWRRRYGSRLRAWLEALATFEVLLSLAGFSFEHPHDPFPEFSEGPPSFEAHSLGHPLLAAASAVPNDLAFGGHTQLVIVSGSNMSGKSTLLRSVGVNTVLAFAGAPVRARRLRLTPLHVVASIQVQDSLQEGHSRFFAEILRLRAITKAAHAHGPVLFLLDELLAGTNSHDRLVGAQGLIRELLATGSIGLLSTHDLALTQVAAQGSTAVGTRNLHFADQIVGDKLSFDYRLREGVVEHSNGLALMRLIGLNV